jgi:2-(1,2-epoxy-1,2-dihydrophenyl)acetyl-CoA isomerase
MSNSRINVTVDGPLVRLRLIRPDAANTIDLAFAQELEEAASVCAEKSVRAVLLTAEGPRFCGGGDLKSFASQADVGAHIRDVTYHLHRGIAVLTEMAAPVVAAVRGAAAGAGLGLVCAADIVIAASSTRFVMAYTAVGLSPDGSTSFFMPQLVGPRRALDMALTNRPMGVDEALACGLVSRVAEDSALDDEAEALAAQLAAGPTVAFGRAKRLVRTDGNDLRAHMELERELIVESAGDDDGREGISAFVEKRPPQFSGR